MNTGGQVYTPCRHGAVLPAQHLQPSSLLSAMWSAKPDRASARGQHRLPSHGDPDRARPRQPPQPGLGNLLNCNWCTGPAEGLPCKDISPKRKPPHR